MEYHFIKQDFTLKVKTDVGDVESRFSLSLATAKDNEIKLDLKSEKETAKNYDAFKKLQKQQILKLFFNGKER